MITAAEIQAVLLGGGGAISMILAGIGILRLCNSGATYIGRIPVALTTGAEELAKLRLAVERDQSMVNLVTQQAGVLQCMREDQAKTLGEIELLHREMRIFARKVEVSGYVESTG
jgi:hypothetical protein